MEFELSLSQEKNTQLTKLVELFLDWNGKLNLSAIRDEEGVRVKHVIDSLYISKFLDFSQFKNCLDMGTGGGFPALPLGIIFPHLHVTACDATQKKIRAVAAISEDLDLKNFEAISGRAEELAKDLNYREQYDLVTARAVAYLPTLLEWLSPFVKKGGIIACYKKDDYEEELKMSEQAMKELSLELEEVYKYELSEETGKRSLIVFTKTKNISKMFPRGVGVAKTKPL